MKMCGYRLALTALTPQNTTQYSSYWRLAGPRAGLDAIEKSKTLGPYENRTPIT